MHWCAKPTPLRQWVQAQVVEPSVLGARLVIADCPSTAYLPALLSATALQCSSTQRGQRGAARDVYVIHLTDAKMSRCWPRSYSWCYPCLKMTDLSGLRASAFGSCKRCDTYSMPGIQTLHMQALQMFGRVDPVRDRAHLQYEL